MSFGTYVIPDWKSKSNKNNENVVYLLTNFSQLKSSISKIESRNIFSLLIEIENVCVFPQHF